MTRDQDSPITPRPESKRKRQERRAWAKLARQTERHVSKQKLKQVTKEQ